MNPNTLRAMQLWINGNKIECRHKRFGDYFDLPSIDNKENEYILFSDEYIYRLKAQEKISINGSFIDAPIREPLSLGEEYYTPFIGEPAAGITMKSKWRNDATNHKDLKYGLVHKTERSAEDHAIALINASGGDYEVDD